MGRQTGGQTDRQAGVLLVGLLALYEAGPLQGDPGEQPPGVAVGEHSRCAAQEHIRLHVPTDTQTGGQTDRETDRWSFKDHQTHR